MPFFAATSTTEREKMRRTFVRSFFPFEVRQLYSKQRWWYLRLLTFSPLRVLRAGVKGNIYLVSRPRQIFAINLRSHVTIARKKDKYWDTWCPLCTWTEGQKYRDEAAAAAKSWAFLCLKWDNFYTGAIFFAWPDFMSFFARKFKVVGESFTMEINQCV